MLKRALKWMGLLLAAIAVVSVINPFMAYHVKRYASVQFGDYYEYSGVVDIRTTYSDGSDTYEQIGRICDSLGLHFAIVADTNTVEPLKAGLDKRWGMTLIVPAVEISGRHGNERFIVLGDSIPLLPGSGVSVDSVIDDASRKGSSIILAQSLGSATKPDLRAGDNEDLTGMEVYNFERSWRSMFNIFQINKLFGAYLAYSVDPRTLNYVLQYPQKEMREFDRLNELRKVVGIGALGARSNIEFGRNKSWHYPSYENMFNLVHTIIVTTTPYNALYHHDREITLNAIRKGNTYVAFSGLEPARGFLFTATSGDMRAIMGDSLRLIGEGTLRISLPDSVSVETQIVRNGEVVATYDKAGTTVLNIHSPGVYRVQVFQKRTMLPFFMKRSYPWILSNPIYVYEK